MPPGGRDFAAARRVGCADESARRDRRRRNRRAVGGAVPAPGRASRDMRVYERQPELGEIGAGIQIAPNAVRVLRGSASATRCGGRASRSRCRGSSGAGRTARPVQPALRRRGRGALRRAVPRHPPRGAARRARATRCPTASSRWAARDGVSTRATGLGRFEDGSAERFDVVIGADGIHSVVREAMLGDGVAGVHRPRRLPRAGAGRGGARSSRAGRSARSGSARAGTSSTTPCPAAAQVNLVTANPAGDWREESWTAEGTVEDFAAEFAGWAEPVRQLIGAATRDQALRVLRARAGGAWVARTRRDPRRRRPPDAAVLRPGRGPGDRGRRGPGGCLRGVPPAASRAPAALRVAAPRARDARPARVARAARAPPHAGRRRSSSRATRRWRSRTRWATTSGSTATTWRRICQRFQCRAGGLAMRRGPPGSSWGERPAKQRQVGRGSGRAVDIIGARGCGTEGGLTGSSVYRTPIDAPTRTIDHAGVASYRRHNWRRVRTHLLGACRFACLLPQDDP